MTFGAVVNHIGVDLEVILRVARPTALLLQVVVVVRRGTLGTRGTRTGYGNMDFATSGFGNILSATGAAGHHDLVG